MQPILLTGDTLTPADLAAVGRGRAVAVDPEGYARMAAARAVIDAAVAERRPVYGVTTGLGPRATEALPAEALAGFSRQTIMGRAHAVGTPLPPRLVRAAMAVRLNTLLIGAAGASTGTAEVLADCLGAGLTPVVGSIASVGAADLLWGASMARGLIGEGLMEGADGTRGPAAERLAAHGIAPFVPGPRDGLALTSHSCFTAAIGATGVAELEVCLEAAATAAALSMEAFRANLTPFDPRVIALRPQPGQAEAAMMVLSRLEGSGLHEPGAARRLQDPLSFRNIPQVLGAVWAALDHARIAVVAEINGASDNPVVLVEHGEVISGGGYHTPHLAVALSGLGLGWAHLAAGHAGRVARLLAGRFTDLGTGLPAPDTGAAGLGPILKLAEALMAEIAHLAQPAPVYAGSSADGLEDSVTHAAIPAKALIDIAERARLLVAVELVVAAQALDLRRAASAPKVAPAVVEAHARLREVLPFLTEDIPLSGALETLAALVGEGAFGLP